MACGVAAVVPFIWMAGKINDVIVGAGGSQEKGLTCMSHTTVVVVGAGLAGLSAAIEARKAGAAHVLLLEAADRVGGNSAKASSGMNWVASDTGDSADLFAEDTLRSGGGRSDATLIRRLVEDSPGAREFLEAHGVVLGKRAQCGAHSVPRTHRNEPPGPNVGFLLVRALDEAARAAGVAVRPQARVTQLLRLHDGTVAGVAVDGEELRAGAVVLATGGFAANVTLVRQWAGHLSAYPTTNGPTASGDGIALGVTAGAALKDMDQVQVHPTSLVNRSAPDARSNWLAPEALRGAGGVLLDAQGRRFVDELATRAEVSRAIAELPGARAALVLGAPAARSFGLAALRVYVAKGLAWEGPDLDSLARHLDVDPKALVAELKAYDALAVRVAEGEAVKDAYGKRVFPAPLWQQGPLPGGDLVGWFALLVTPALHYTMGGLVIDEEARVVGRSASPIPGLFAAGEVTGGVHGANRLAGNSLLECVVFGRIAGRGAAAAAMAGAEGQPCCS